MSFPGRDSQTGVTLVPGPEKCWAPANASNQNSALFIFKCASVHAAFFLLSLYEDKIIFLKIGVASATDWGTPHVSFNLGIDHLSATVGATRTCLRLHHTYQLLDAWPKPALSLLGSLAKPCGLAVLRGSPSPAAAPSKQENWER